MSSTQTAPAAPARSADAAKPPMPERPPVAWGVIGALAAVKLALHLATNAFTAYGVHRDELLYLAMGRHLHLWRMDFPPFIALVGQAERAATGDSLLSIRLAAALAGTLLLVLAALAARELGGGRFAQGTAALAVLAGVLFQRSANLFQPVVFDQLWWTLALFALLRLCRARNPRWWLAAGLACGLGMLTKFSIGFFMAGLFGGMLLTKHRWWLFTIWPWAALLLALGIGSPGIVGQVRLGFPVTASMAELSHSQLAHVGYVDFLLGQAEMIGPAILLAIAGVVSLLVGRARAFRLVGWACVLPIGILMLLHGKAYYAGPVYPTLIAAGAASLGALRVRFVAPALRWVTVGLVAAAGLALLPLGVPILPPERMAAYTDALHLTTLVDRNNQGGLERLPQDYADMLGWPEQAAAVARVYRALAPEKRARAVVWGGNYGEAGALDFYGPRLGLPPAVSNAGSFWFFGPGTRPGDVLVSIGSKEEDLRKAFSVVTPAGTVGHPWAVGEERSVPIFVSEQPRQPLQAVWPRLAGRQ